MVKITGNENFILKVIEGDKMSECSKKNTCVNFPDACSECQIISDFNFPYQLYKKFTPGTTREQHFANGVHEIAEKLKEHYTNQIGLIVITKEELISLANEIIDSVY